VPAGPVLAQDADSEANTPPKKADSGQEGGKVDAEDPQPGDPQASESRDEQGPAEDAEQADEAPLPTKRFYEQEPYDLITLDAANNNEVLKVLPLPFRELPEPAKRAGRLKIRLFDMREEEYEVMWRHIVQVDFFEELVLREAEQLVQRAFQAGRAGEHAESLKQFDEAYDFFQWLMVHHPEVDGLDKGIQDYLYLNAGTLFLIGTQREKDAAAATDEPLAERLRKQAFDSYARAVAILEELVSQNAQYVYGAKSTVFDLLERVADRLLGWYEKQGNFGAVRNLLVRLQKQHRDRLGVGQTWQQRLIDEATAKRDAAREHMQAQRFAEAHEAAGEMLKIWPRVDGGRDLVLELSRVYPLIVVGVSQPALAADPTSLDNFAVRRAGHLVYPTLIEFQERGPEGGRYASPFGAVQQSDDRRQLIFDLHSGNASDPFTGYDLSRNLLAMTDPSGSRYDPAWSSLVSTLEVEDVMRVRVALRHPHVLPQAVLRSRFQLGDQFASRYTVEPLSDIETRFAPAEGMADTGQPRPVIVERFIEQPRAAIEQLRRGRIDMIDRLLPADALRLQQEPGIEIGTYGFPTLMMLAVNTDNPYLGQPHVPAGSGLRDQPPGHSGAGAVQRPAGAGHAGAQRPVAGGRQRPRSLGLCV
jgi:tetratricopeptide (TPR) repeat protein